MTKYLNIGNLKNGNITDENSNPILKRQFTERFKVVDESFPQKWIGFGYGEHFVNIESKTKFCLTSTLRPTKISNLQEETTKNRSAIVWNRKIHGKNSDFSLGFLKCRRC